MKKSTLKQIVKSQKRNQAVALVTNLEDSQQHIFVRESLKNRSRIETLVTDSFLNDRSKLVQIDSCRFFIQVFNVPLRLLIVGAVHIAKPLISIAKSCDFNVTLIDPRRAFASSDRFPEIELLHEWPDIALENLGLNDRTAVVTLTHDPKLDEPALVKALLSDAFYIGALGSTRTHAQRCERLTEAGISAEQLNRICAPVGLNISAQSPAEIAVSIMAEITQSLRRPAER